MAFKRKVEKRLTARFETRLAKEELMRLREMARVAGLTKSEFARRRILQYPILASVDMTMIRELRRLGGLMKITIKQALEHREITDECRATIVALRDAVERVGHNGD